MGGELKKFTTHSMECHTEKKVERGNIQNNKVWTLKSKICEDIVMNSSNINTQVHVKTHSTEAVEHQW